MMMPQITVCTAIMATSFALALDIECSTMGDIYKDGTDLCETMWDGSFEVVDDDDGYTMWFFESDGRNPNDELSALRNLTGANNQCFLDYLHKEVPTRESLNECHVFEGSACCYTENVTDPETINRNYGPGYHWDRCGKLSEQCERFFVQEACMYECDPNVGYFRKFKDPKVGFVDGDSERREYNPKCNPGDYSAYDDIDPNNWSSPTGEKYLKEHSSECGKMAHNKWRLYKMPIKRSYCDSWYAACKRDFFCSKGNFFADECIQVVPEEPEEVVVEEVFSLGAIIGIATALTLFVIAGVVIVFLIYKERAGKPVFVLLEETDTELSTDRE